MKYIAIITLALLVSSNLHAQIATNTEMKDSTNIYFQAYKVYCKQQKENNSPLLVEENNITTKSLPLECFGHKTEITNIDKLQLLVKERKKVQLLRLVPLRIKDGSFFVNIVVFNVERKGKQFDFINAGGISVVFEYDSNSKLFIFKEIR